MCWKIAVGFLRTSDCRVTMKFDKRTYYSRVKSIREVGAVWMATTTVRYSVSHPCE